MASTTSTTVSIAVGPGNGLPTSRITTVSTPNVALATLTSTITLAIKLSESSAESVDALSSGDLLIMAGAIGSAALLALVGVGAVLVRRRRMSKNAEIKPSEYGVDVNNPYAGSSQRTEGLTVPYPLWGNSMSSATNQNISMARLAQGQYFNPSSNMTPMFQSIPQPMNGGQMYSTAGRPTSAGTFYPSNNMPSMFVAPQSMYNSRPRTGAPTSAGQWQGTQF